MCIIPVSGEVFVLSLFKYLKFSDVSGDVLPCKINKAILHFPKWTDYGNSVV